jgi:hypothetical protein
MTLSKAFRQLFFALTLTLVPATPAFAGESCSLSVNNKYGGVLSVKGWCEGDPKKTGTVFSEFTISSARCKKCKSPEFSASALDHYWIQTQGDHLLLTELTYLQGKWTPIFTRTFDCTTKKCKASSERCALTRLQLDDPSVGTAIEKKLAALDPDEQLDEVFIQSVADLAWTGNPRAQAFFRTKQKLKLDGAALELHSRVFATLGRLSRAQCFKK